MFIDEKQELLRKHGNYKYIFMSNEELNEELKNWNRLDLINWLKWNDPNGVYDDAQSLQEFGNVLSFEEGKEILINQITQINA